MNHNDHPINWVPATDAHLSRFTRPEDGERVNILELDGRIRTAYAIFGAGVLTFEDDLGEHYGPEDVYWSRPMPVNVNRRRDSLQRKQNQMASDFNGEFSGRARREETNSGEKT